MQYASLELTLCRFKAVRFYPYDTALIGNVVYLNEVSDAEQRTSVDDVIDQFRQKLASLYLTNKDSRGFHLSSTGLDNKTVIELSDGENTLFIGKRDFRYSVGLSRMLIDPEYNSKYIIECDNIALK